MSESDQTYAGPERRQESNANLRSEFDEIGDRAVATPKLAKDDMSRLFDLLRDCHKRGRGVRWPDLLRLVRDEHPDELSPAMLALLDDVLGREA